MLALSVIYLRWIHMYVNMLSYLLLGVSVAALFNIWHDVRIRKALLRRAALVFAPAFVLLFIVCAIHLWYRYGHGFPYWLVSNPAVATLPGFGLFLGLKK